MKIFKIWVIILAFVSSQLAWNLRPFVGSRDLPFELFRARESNFYIAVIQSVVNIFEPKKISDQKDNDKKNDQQKDNILNKANDQR
jgi:hypothetical protein